MKAIMKYPGSKWSLADWIINFFPDHHSYLEPFFGSGAVLFNKPRSNMETVNDLDGNVVNLFEWIKRDPEQLAHEIYWTPYARQVYEDTFTREPENSLQKAVDFYIRLNMGYGYRTSGYREGWKNDVQGREKAYAAMDWKDLPGKIKQAAERLRGVQIENRPAVDVIGRLIIPMCWSMQIRRMCWIPEMGSSTDMRWKTKTRMTCWMCCLPIKGKSFYPDMTANYIMTGLRAGTGERLPVITN